MKWWKTVFVIVIRSASCGHFPLQFIFDVSHTHPVLQYTMYTNILEWCVRDLKLLFEQLSAVGARLSLECDEWYGMEGFFFSLTEFIDSSIALTFQFTISSVVVVFELSEPPAQPVQTALGHHVRIQRYDQPSDGEIRFYAQVRNV